MTAYLETGLSIPVVATIISIDTQPFQDYDETGLDIVAALTIEVTDDTQYPVTQRSFRWRNDDGDELAATPRWRQGENAPAPIGESVRLRVQLDSDINPLPKQYKLQYRMSSGLGTSWGDVPVGAGGTSGAVKFGGPLEFDPASGYSLATASFAGDAFTIAGWFMLEDDPRAYNFYQPFWSIEHATESDRSQLMTTLDGHTMYWSTNVGGKTAGYMSYGSWYYIACVCGGPVGPFADHIYWSLGDDPFTVETTDVGPGDPACSFYIGVAPREAIARLVGRVSQVRIWTAALTQEEVEGERNALSVQRTDDLWAYYSFADGPQTTDESGNGHTLTPIGTPSYVGSPAPIIIVPSPIYLSTSSYIDAAGEDTTPLLRPPTGKTTADFGAGRMWDNRNGVEQVDF